MSTIDPADAYVAARVMARICEAQRLPLDVHLNVADIQEFRPFVRPDHRHHLDTTARVLAALTAKTGRSAHTIAHVGHYDLGVHHYNSRRKA